MGSSKPTYSCKSCGAILDSNDKTCPRCKADLSKTGRNISLTLTDSIKLKLSDKTEELEEILEGGTETPRVEFKEKHKWEVKLFAKDILAMSNVQDGGYIVIGVEDRTLARQGVDKTTKESYQIDIMRDQMTAYADPHVNFTVEFPKDRNSLEFAVIKVNQFEEIPVICRKTDPTAGTQEGVLYYRSTNRRVESAPVSNSYDLRTILELATVKMMQRRTQIGYTVNAGTKKQLDDELEGL